jgi:apolipoprotein N-acyltransferase
VRALALPAGSGLGWARAGAAAGCGVVLGVAQVPVSWPLALFVALPALLWLLEHARDWRGGFRVGWFAGAGYFAATLFWIVEPFLVDAPRHGWMAPFALAGMAFGLALFWALPFAVARALPGGGAARAVALACLWTASEYLRARFLGGFPWALPAYAWVETPVMQAASWAGPHGLGLVTLLAGLAVGLRRPWGAAAGAAIVAGLWGWGAWRLAQPVPAREEAVAVRLVQPNAAQDLKWDPAMQAAFYGRLIGSTAAPPAPGARRPDVVIWPETAVPALLGETGWFEAEAAAAAGEGTALILGIRRREPAPGGGERWYNSLAVIGGGGAVAALYDKHHLVPFGEYIPLGERIAALGLPRLSGLAAAGFSAGPGPRLVTAEGLPPFLPLICYEAIFPGGMDPPGGRPEWLVQITNDAWFGRLSGPYQHLAQARVRAIEQGLPLARAANTGVTAMIDARGRVVARLELGEAGSLDAELPGAAPATIHSRTGDWPALAAVLLVFSLTFAKTLGSNSGRHPT